MDERNKNKTYSVRLNQWDIKALDRIAEEMKLEYLMHGLSVKIDRSHVIKQVIGIVAMQIAEKQQRSVIDWLENKDKR